MKTFKRIILIFMAVSFTLACNSKKQNNSVISQTIKDSIQWEGTYEGVLPAADCPGIYTLLAIDDDGKYEMFEKYLERDGFFVTKGGFEWNATEDTIYLLTDSKIAFAVQDKKLVTPNSFLERVCGEDDLDDAYTAHCVKDDKTGRNYDVEIYSKDKAVVAEIEIDDKDYTLKKESENDKECVFSDGTATLKWNVSGNYKPQFTDGRNTYNFTLLGPGNVIYEAIDDNAPVKTLVVMFFNPEEEKSFVKILTPKAENCYTLTQTEASAKTAVYKKDGITWETKVNNEAGLDINGHTYGYKNIKK